MKQNRQFRGMGFILLIMVALTFFSALTQQKLLEEQMTYQEFMVAIENKSVKMVQIEQNPQTPTGNLIVATTDGEYHDMAVSDVLEIQELLRANGIDYRLEDVPQENYLITVILPAGCDRSAVSDERKSKRRRECQDDEFWQEPCTDDKDKQH